MGKKIFFRFFRFFLIFLIKKHKLGRVTTISESAVIRHGLAHEAHTRHKHEAHTVSLFSLEIRQSRLIPRRRSRMLYSWMGLSESAEGVMEERQKRFSRYQKVL